MYYILYGIRTIFLPLVYLMSVHFEAKTNLYFVLCVYKMVTIFLGKGELNSLQEDFILHITFLTIVAAIVCIEVDGLSSL